MNRRHFVKSCCTGAVGTTAFGIGLHSCAPIYYANTSLSNNIITVEKSEFSGNKNNKEYIRKFIMIKIETLEYPICLYKIGKEEYTASLMMCTHRGCELNVGGGIYSCPCHGSEFGNDGKLLEGPADKDLKTFKTELNNDKIFISLS